MAKSVQDLDPMEYLAFNISMVQYLMREGSSWELIQAQIPSLILAAKRAMAADPAVPGQIVRILQPVPDDVAAMLADGEICPDTPEGLGE